jgi:hypothetical protein
MEMVHRPVDQWAHDAMHPAPTPLGPSDLSCTLLIQLLEQKGLGQRWRCHSSMTERPPELGRMALWLTGGRREGWRRERATGKFQGCTH